MNKHMSFLGIILLLINVLGCKCKKTEITDCFEPTNPLCKNYDPCYGKKPVSAEFIIEDKLNLVDPETFIIENETLTLGTIRFTALEENAKYTWYLGIEVLHDKQIQRNFYEDTRGKNITVSLVVEKDSDAKCFPIDDGRDSVSKTFYIVEDVCQLDIDNSFKGVLNTAPNDSFVCSVAFYTITGGGYIPCGTGNITQFENLRNLGDTERVSTYPCTNSYMRMTDRAINRPFGEIKVNKSKNHVYMKYRWENVDYEFNGRILN